MRLMETLAAKHHTFVPVQSQGLLESSAGGGRGVTFPPVTQSMAPSGTLLSQRVLRAVCLLETRQLLVTPCSHLSLREAAASQSIFKKAARVAVDPRELQDPPPPALWSSGNREAISSP